jgi:drug/metabolite transporter (DMT)-like permease
MTDGRQRQLLALCLAAVYLIWGSSYLATRVGLQTLPPLLFGGLRFVISGVILLAVAYWRGFSLQQVHGQWRHLLVMTLLCIVLCNGLQIWSMQWVPSNTSALLNASSPLWIVVFGLFGVRAHRPDAREIIGLVVGFLGTLLLIAPAGAAQSATSSTPLLPQLETLLASVLWALGTIYMRNHSMQIDLFALIGLQMLLGGIVLGLAGIARGELYAWQWSPQGMLAMGYLVVFSSCLAYVAYGWLARHATPAQTGSYGYVNPAIAAVMGYWVLKETLTGIQLLGAAVMLAGVVLINWPQRTASSDAVAAKQAAI